MPLQKFIFNPGINKEGTDYTAEGGWFDGNLVRFRKGLPEKIGGWQKYIQASYEGTAQNFWASARGSNCIYKKARVITILRRYGKPPVRATSPLLLPTDRAL